jgi:hypothetical protein
LTGQATGPGRRLIPLSPTATDTVRSWQSRRALSGGQVRT